MNRDAADDPKLSPYIELGLKITCSFFKMIKLYQCILGLLKMKLYFEQLLQSFGNRENKDYSSVWQMRLRCEINSDTPSTIPHSMHYSIKFNNAIINFDPLITFQRFPCVNVTIIMLQITCSINWLLILSLFFHDCNMRKAQKWTL